MANSNVTFKSTLVSRFVPNTDRQLDAGVLEMAIDIQKRASILAPVDTRNLANSGRVQKIGSGIYRVIFGSSRVPYARIRHFENNKNPHTIGYLRRAGDSVARNSAGKYFKKR